MTRSGRCLAKRGGDGEARGEGQRMKCRREGGEGAEGGGYGRRRRACVALPRRRHVGVPLCEWAQRVPATMVESKPQSEQVTTVNVAGIKSPSMMYVTVRPQLCFSLCAVLCTTRKSKRTHARARVAREYVTSHAHARGVPASDAPPWSVYTFLVKFSVHPLKLIESLLLVALVPIFEGRPLVYFHGGRRPGYR
ncbi:hypothetical protein EVAR_44746_1 [Eumeta japonica]|uniref:Uncharacterized protein n=1 Tax=Eumeta variegata TaxID=151549 RepID=A0A4C1XF60_EUMVA|nr:hypothetical protein EVAR_44746_1 [Eumeta japonica]